MQRLETRIAALEANIKIEPPPSYAADVVEAYREVLGVEVPDALPGELLGDWYGRFSNEAIDALMQYIDSQSESSN